MAKQRDYKREYELKLARGEHLLSKVVGLRLSNDVYNDFTLAAKKNGKTRTEVLHEYVLAYIEKNRD